MAQLFDTSTDNISLHLKNIYAEAELEEKTTTEDYSVVRAEGKRQVTWQIKHYNLDAVLSVGYRVKSKNATQFRRWATARLKDYRLKGYALNQQRLQQNAAELEQALRLIQKTAASPDLTVDSGRGLMDIISRYTHTFLWLQQYDAGLLQEPSGESGASCPACKKRAPRCIPSNNNSSRAARRLNFSPVSGKTVSPPRLVTSNKAFSAPPPSH